MPFPASHLYLTLHWTNTSMPGEHGQTGVRFDSPHAATQTRVNALNTTAQTFWGALGNIGTDYKLEFLRLARVGANGLYSNASSFDYLWGVGTNGFGGATSAVPFPLQVACVSTLVTATPHGPASKGRMYLPPPPAALTGSLRFGASAMASRSAALAAFLTSAGGILGGPAAVFSKGTARAPGGAVHAVTGVETGDRPDVQRRRAKGITETYSAVSTVSPPPRDAGAAEDDLLPSLP